MTPCLVCGTPTRGNRCPTHPLPPRRRTVARAQRSRNEWRRVAAEVLQAHVATVGWWCPGTAQHEPHPSQDLTVDHVVPLADGGALVGGALRVLCRAENSRRGGLQSGRLGRRRGRRQG